MRGLGLAVGVWLGLLSLLATACQASPAVTQTPVTSPTAAVLAGEVHVLVAAEQPIQATLNGADLAFIAAPTATIFYSLYARPEIADAASLKGKKVASPGPAPRQRLPQRWRCAA